MYIAKSKLYHVVMPVTLILIPALVFIDQVSSLAHPVHPDFWLPENHDQ